MTEERLPGRDHARAALKDGAIHIWQGARLIVLQREQAQGLADFIVMSLQGGKPIEWKHYRGGHNAD